MVKGWSVDLHDIHSVPPSENIDPHQSIPENKMEDSTAMPNYTTASMTTQSPGMMDDNSTQDILMSTSCLIKLFLTLFNRCGVYT